MNDIMIDIETLGTQSYAAILSIGAVRFDLKTGKIGNKLYLPIDLKSCEMVGLNKEADSIKWWFDQSKEAQDAFNKSKSMPLITALFKLNDFVDKDARVWGNSARFDLGLISNAFHRLQLDIPWNYKNEMCVRTLSNLVPEVKAEHQWKGVAHDPISDCLNQIEYTCKIWQQLKPLNAKIEPLNPQ